MNLLFWNLKNNDIGDYIKGCLQENEIDVAIFAEHKGIDFPTLFSASHHYRWIESVDVSNRIQMVVSDRCSDVVVRQQQGRYSIYFLSFNMKRYVITGVHLEDRRNYPDSGVRIDTIKRMKNDISNAEGVANSKNSIIIGDFNANPYDPEFLQVSALNAVLFKEIIKKSETVNFAGERHRRFYNPILDYLSDSRNNRGSFYFSSGFSNPIWNCLDQIVVSKELVDDINDLQYLQSVLGKPLIKDVKPNSDISDHLPIFVTMN